MKSNVVVISCAVLVALTVSEPSGASRGKLPPSVFPGVKAINSIERRVLQHVDVEGLLAEDAVREGSGRAVPARFAKHIRVNLSPNNSGTWEEVSDGSRLWRLRIASPGALSLSLGLEKLDLPAGASFWVHAPDGSYVQGPYTAEHRNASGGLWTAVVLGDELVAELQVPPGMTTGFEITTVAHGYRIFGEREAGLETKRGSCNINVACPEGNRFADQIRSVARITFSDGGSSYLCTGQLINNTAEDDTPYLLTAGHCINSQDAATSLVTYWNYETPTCESFFGGSLTQNQSGATLVASSYNSENDFQYDFALLELDETPAPEFDVYYLGWDARGLIPRSTTTIHHPRGDQKSISFDFDAPTVTSYLGSASPGDGRHLRVSDWDLGTTEGGSSGGCLLDETSGLCVGTLTGGYAACGNDAPDWFARVSQQFPGEGNPDGRLSDWLDPLDSDAGYLTGKYPGPEIEASQTWLIPSVASLPGFAGSNWKSQISVVNTSRRSLNAMVYFVPDGADWPGELFSGPHLIGPTGSLYLDDPLLPENPTAGLMYITVNGDGTAAFSRTINLEDDGSTFGQGMPAVLLNDASMVTELVLPMVHSAPDRYRTNIGFAQTSGGRFRVLISIYSADSVLLAEREYSIYTAWRQMNDIFGTLGIGDATVDGAWIRVQVIGGSPAYWTTYATVIDNVTNDPTYVLPVAP